MNAAVKSVFHFKLQITRRLCKMNAAELYGT